MHQYNSKNSNWWQLALIVHQDYVYKKHENANYLVKKINELHPESEEVNFTLSDTPKLLASFPPSPTPKVSKQVI